MPAFICITCGTQFAPSEKAPERCPICDEDRQYVPPSGQAWTTHDALERSHFNCFRQHEKDLIGIGTVPMFAIGQRALLLATDKGNVLWDCISLLDHATVAIVKALGGLDRHRNLASALLRFDGRVGACLRRRRSICTPATANGSCGRIRR